MKGKTLLPHFEAYEAETSEVASDGNDTFALFERSFKVLTPLNLNCAVKVALIERIDGCKHFKIVFDGIDRRLSIKSQLLPYLFSFPKARLRFPSTLFL